MNRLRYWRIRWWEWRIARHGRGIVRIAKRGARHYSSYSEVFARRASELGVDTKTEAFGMTLDPAAQQRRAHGSMN